MDNKPTTDILARILLVEDEEMIRDLYARQLNKANFYVKPVATGEDGLEALRNETFDLVLLDIMLPGINGLQMLREYKLKHPESKTIVILLTNLGQESVIKEGFDLGAHAYLIKTSYTPDQIIQEVKNALAGKESTPATSPTV
jgi:DNA-binding response OmpR family regulator